MSDVDEELVYYNGELMPFRKFLELIAPQIEQKRIPTFSPRERIENIRKEVSEILYVNGDEEICSLAIAKLQKLRHRLENVILKETETELFAKKTELLTFIDNFIAKIENAKTAEFTCPLRTLDEKMRCSLIWRNVVKVEGSVFCVNPNKKCWIYQMYFKRRALLRLL
jgi:hypothetical protein